MVRNADKKVSGGSEAEKGSGSEEVKRCKKKLPPVKNCSLKGVRRTGSWLYYKEYFQELFSGWAKEKYTVKKLGGSKDVPDFRCEMLGGRPSF